MVLSFKNLPIGIRSPDIVNAIVEIPKGSRNKYEFDLELGVFRLDRVLYSSMHYPAAYGFVPSTLYEDGDPVDVLIIIDQPLSTGVLVEVRPIGVLRMYDEHGSDDKILSVAVHDPTYKTVNEVNHLPSHLLVEIEHFFTSYKNLEGKMVKSFGWDSAQAARQAIAGAAKNFNAKLTNHPKSKINTNSRKQKRIK